MNSKVKYLPVADKKFPLGKQLFLAACAVRRIDSQSAELDWANWEDDFMTKAEWDRTAKLFLKCHGDLQS
jgi:hypothetical protein